LNFEYVGIRKLFKFYKLKCYELNLIDSIRSGEFDEITVKFKDKKMDMILKKHEIKTRDKEQILKIMALKDYYDIELKGQHGKMSYISITDKQKVK